MQLHEMFNRPQHATILEVLAESHYAAAMSNDNTSTAVALAVYAASGDLDNAIRAASLAQGGLHAPIAQARRWFSFKDPVEAARYVLSTGQRLPGFGNSFYKDKIDPAFRHLYEMLPEKQRTVIDSIYVNVIPKHRPNAAIITAAVCEIADLPHGCESTIFTRARVPAWTKLCMERGRRIPKVATP